MTRKMLSQGRRFAAVAAVLVLGGCAATGAPQPRMQTSTEDASLPKLMKLAEQSREAGNESVAADIYEKAAERFPDSAEPFIGLGHAARAAGQTRRATAAFRAALKRNPDSLTARYGLGQSLLDGDRLKAAIEQFDVLIEAGTTDHRPYLAKGVALDLLDRHAAAQASYRAGLAHAPDNVALKNNLGLSLALSQNYQKAMRTLEAVVRDPTAPARARQNLALIYGMAGDMRRAATAAGEDLSPQAVERNIAYYRALNELQGKSAPNGAQPKGDADSADADGPDNAAPAAQAPKQPPDMGDMDMPIRPRDKPVQLAAAVSMPTPSADPGASARGHGSTPPVATSDSSKPPEPASPAAETVKVSEGDEPAAPAKPDANAGNQDVTLQASAGSIDPQPAKPKPANAAGMSPQPQKVADKRADMNGKKGGAADPATKSDGSKTVNEMSRERGTTLAEAMRTQLSATPQQDASNGKTAYWAQFASFDSPDSGKAEWRRLQKRYPKLVAGLPMALHTAELPEKGTFYRVRTGPFDARRAPDRLCDALAEHGQGCLVVER